MSRPPIEGVVAIQRKSSGGGTVRRSRGRKPEAEDLRRLATVMARSRRYEEATLALWERGLISGELHLSVGEEAVAAGVLDHVVDGDAIAADHRSSAVMVARGVSLESMLREVLGDPDGLCGGQGGHMHLLSEEHLAVSDGIVGASGPLACGFALSAALLRPRRIAVAFFGEGAINQGMLMESLNLAVAWQLPVLFVCKDSGWAITTRSAAVTAGDPVRRAASFDMPTARIDGADVVDVWSRAGAMIDRLRERPGPAFLLARVTRPDGHLANDPMIRSLRSPLDEGRELVPGMVSALRRSGGGSAVARLRALADLGGRFGRLGGQLGMAGRRDPLRRVASQVPELDDLLAAAEREVEALIDVVVPGEVAR